MSSDNEPSPHKQASGIYKNESGGSYVVGMMKKQQQQRQLLPRVHKQKSAPWFNTTIMKTENNVLH